MPDINRSKINSALNEVKEALKGSQAAAIKPAQRKAQRDVAGRFGGTSPGGFRRGRPEPDRTGGQPGTQPEAGGTPEGSKKDEGPIIDAEVVYDKK